MTRILERLPMVAEVDSPPFVHHSVPNRSLGPAGRRWFLGAIGATTMVIAAAAAAIGAWPVMPFAGLEIALLMLAFHVVRVHDADFEKIEIGEYEVRVEARDAGTVSRFVAHRPWARIILRERGARCTLGLAYAGRFVPLGRLLSDEGRRKLAQDLRGRIAVTAK
jgi:uncharacterized membrane protein